MNVCHLCLKSLDAWVFIWHFGYSWLSVLDLSVIAKLRQIALAPSILIQRLVSAFLVSTFNFEAWYEHIILLYKCKCRQWDRNVCLNLLRLWWFVSFCVIGWVAIYVTFQIVKAYLRRGTAREMLGYYKEAVDGLSFISLCLILKLSGWKTNCLLVDCVLQILAMPLF